MPRWCALGSGWSAYRQGGISNTNKLLQCRLNLWGVLVRKAPHEAQQDAGIMSPGSNSNAQLYITYLRLLAVLIKIWGCAGEEGPPGGTGGSQDGCAGC